MVSLEQGGALRGGRDVVDERPLPAPAKVFKFGAIFTTFVVVRRVHLHQSLDR